MLSTNDRVQELLHETVLNGIKIAPIRGRSGTVQSGAGGNPPSYVVRWDDATQSTVLETQLAKI
jgi:hypothetical protein